jgi:predicted phage tail component-like protein
MRNFSFNGITKDYLYVLEGANRTPWAPIERLHYEVPNRPGAYSRKKKKTQPRPFPIPVAIKADSKAELELLKEDFAAWLLQDEPKPLVPDDEPNRTYYAEVNGSFDLDEFLYYGRGVIPFICPDPYKYGFEESLELGDYPIRNEGSVESNPIVIANFSAAASEYKIEHANGKFVRIIYNFVAGDKLEIDLTKRKVLINNIVNMPSYYWKSIPFSLLPGENVLTVTSSSVATSTIKFRPRWK